jgi:uncharacterized protein (TIGR03437 family)
VQAQVPFAGASGEFAGLQQINIEIPAAAAAGPAVPIIVRSGHRESNVVTLAVQ